jgi:hypothetical protein
MEAAFLCYLYLLGIYNITIEFVYINQFWYAQWVDIFKQ